MSAYKAPKHIMNSCWQALAEHKEKISGINLQETFKQDPKRAETFSTELDKLYIDYSKHLITEETLALLISTNRPIADIQPTSNHGQNSQGYCTNRLATSGSHS